MLRADLAGWLLLVVEDDFLIAMDLKSTLQLAGGEVLGPVPTADAALALIDSDGGRLNAAVLDVTLGEGSTAQPVAEQLARLGVPYVFATGQRERDDVPCFCGRPWLRKPISDRALVTALISLQERRVTH